MTKVVFFLGLILTATGFVSPPLALAAGLVYALAFRNPYQLPMTGLCKVLLQVSVVLLGFGMNLNEVLKAGRSGFVYTAVGIAAALALGLGIGRLMKVGDKPSFLITAGTAICGGSAIAAVGPITGASDDEMAASLGTVFVLNSVALILFPFVGFALHMTQLQFGLWSALAIHDTSSVVGATARYGAVALAAGTTVKLARALWIVPVCVGAAVVMHSKARIQWPWFILVFCLAALLNTYVPLFGPAYPVLKHLGTIGISVTLFLIGSGLSRQALRKVGIRPLAQGLALWAIVALGSLALIQMGWISL